LAIYHLSANVISRARGQSVVAAAAYRSGAALRDERYGITHNYASRRGVAAHSEIMAPAGAPSWVYDREILWNRVEAGELRKDSQLARGIDVSLPIELGHHECLALVRAYIAMEFVSKGMIADLCICRDNSANPHAYMLLTLRRVTSSGFGPKERRWNGKSNLLGWRSAWAERANEHLARAGHSVRIDHRTLEAQQIELTPSRRVGFGRTLRCDNESPSHLTERLAEQRLIAKANGEAMLEDPAVALRALTHQWPTFTHHDLAQFLRSRTDGAAQFDAVYLAVIRSDDLMALKPDENGLERFTSRDMLDAQKSLMQRAVSMARRRGHGVSPVVQSSILSRFPLNGAQRSDFEYLVSEGDAKAITLVAGDVKDALLHAAHRAWEADGSQVVGVAISRTAAEHLESVSGIKSQPLEICEIEWQKGHGLLTQNGVLLVDGAQMIGLKGLERLLAAAAKVRAKIVLLGDLDPRRGAGAESPFGGVLREIGLAELSRIQS